MPHLQKMPKWTPTGIRFEGQYLHNPCEKKLQAAALQKLQQINDKNAHMGNQRLPKQAFRSREATFLQFFSICYKACKIVSTCTQNDTKIELNWCRDLPKALQKNTLKIGTTKIITNLFWSKHRRK